MRPLIASSGHLNRHRKILEDYQNLILPPLDDSDGGSLNESSESDSTWPWTLATALPQLC